MVFVDPLTIMLIAVAASALLIALYFIDIVKGKRVDDLVVPGFVIGLFNFISGFFMSFAWPFPGAMSAYNMLFGDPLLFLGLIMMSAAVMYYKKTDIKILSMFGFLIGIYLLVETYAIAALNLESGIHFLPSFGFYLFSALAAIFSPLIYINPKKNGKYIYYFLACLLIISALLALFIGVTGIYEHLVSPP
ncbi:MAG: DUF981 family protein [Candidatus Marsarchaeota archaeon]|jgi:putative membrane protein|nr:DUF981 family protein [Candidatus Marsarchaeota archaeon]